MSERAAVLRAAFDRGFAEAPAGAATVKAAFLAIRAGEQERAVRLSEIAAVHVDRKVVPVPSPAPALLGLAAFRGAVVPVYDLRMLLGASRASPPRWLLIASAAPVAFAFDSFDGHLAVTADELAGGAAELVVNGGRSRTVISLTTLIAGLVRSPET